jgi:hypothetical protein
MYLAKLHIDDKTLYVIRHSYVDDTCMKSRDIFDLGPDPSRFIIYPGGVGYYYDPCIEAACAQKGVAVDQNALDEVFYRFLRPDVRRVISGFDRRRRYTAPRSARFQLHHVHKFDKRRYYYLRFGRSAREHIDRVPQRVFYPLMEKSRDELEQYFQTEENRISPGERSNYLMAIFQLHRLRPDMQTGLTWRRQLDDFFIERLCSLNIDSTFLAGTPAFDGLYPYLVSYAIEYFDGPVRLQNDPYAAMREFIRRHRAYKPPQTVQVKIKEAERLMGCPWKALQKMDRSELARRYRKAAIKHHPDQGGDPEAFRRLTQVYQALKGRKPGK